VDVNAWPHAFRPYLPAYHHAFLASQHPARDLVGDLFLGDRRMQNSTPKNATKKISLEQFRLYGGHNRREPKLSQKGAFYASLKIVGRLADAFEVESEELLKRQKTLLRRR
jgi:hypothetical protein